MKVKCLLLLAVAAMSLSAYAQDAQPGIPTPDHLYFKGNAVGEDLDGTRSTLEFTEGNEALLTLYLDDTSIRSGAVEGYEGTTYTDFSLSFKLPAGFTVKKNSRGYIINKLDRATSTHSPNISNSSEENNEWYLMCYSDKGWELSGEDEDKGINDPILSLTIVAEEDAIANKGKVGEITIFDQQLPNPADKGQTFFFYGTGGQGVAPRVITPISLEVFGSTAVTELGVDKAFAGVKYYNAAGLESNVPFDGVNIVVTKYVDGTTKAVKVVK